MEERGELLFEYVQPKKYMIWTIGYFTSGGIIGFVLGMILFGTTGNWMSILKIIITFLFISSFFSGPYILSEYDNNYIIDKNGINIKLTYIDKSGAKRRYCFYPWNRIRSIRFVRTYWPFYRSQPTGFLYTIETFDDKKFYMSVDAKRDLFLLDCFKTGLGDRWEIVYNNKT